MLRVIDTSYWKKDIVTTEVDIDAVYTKATEGNYYVDDSCDPIVEWAKARGKKWGVYHFGTNRITDAVTEANFFVDNCAGYVGGGILILDNENYRWGDGTFAHDANDVGWALAWCNHVFARTGVRPLIYMSLSVITGNDWSPVINGGYGLICAAYPENNNPVPNFQFDSGRDPNPAWDGVVNDVLWQFTSTGQLSGYGGNLDCNFFYGDGNTWDAYARPVGQAPAPQPVPEQPAPPIQPVPIPEPETPPSEPVPQAPADPTHPDNDHFPTPTPLPTPEPTPTPDPTKPATSKTIIAAIIAAIVAAIAFVVQWLHS